MYTCGLFVFEWNFISFKCLNIIFQNTNLIENWNWVSLSSHSMKYVRMFSPWAFHLDRTILSGRLLKGKHVYMFHRVRQFWNLKIKVILTNSMQISWRINDMDSDICVLCNQNSIMSSEHLFQCSSLNRERQV